ncbi:OpgC domain-containing protein [Pararobbsia silviterrae]|uniref:OpgC domain-containing protein n=1 Tax=Pararobbsia silviterrae TaxID=1792498 RepID=A0A494XXC4_9BURK|nr:OpgC domain-containing protein [Pararobbsia silviterrae]RKP54565.1 OpgC domain-containing protein [Pararobbsia silviterrae]
MNSVAGRSLDVDFFRGLVLIVIALDHVTGSVLSRFMLHTYAFCDSAEVFVFLGGYASAAAYCAVASHRGEQAAVWRFARRSAEIYRAYLFTALLMLLCGGMLALFDPNPAMLDMTEWRHFVTQPFDVLGDIVLFKRQPYLASVLPMYVAFALCVPLVVPLAQRSFSTALATSVLVWVLAPWLAFLVPVVHTQDWGFNPFAWQAMFVGGVLARLYPVRAEFARSRSARWLTAVALVAFVAFAVARLVVFKDPLPGVMKQQLSLVRIVDFAAMAWLVSVAVRAGWIRAIAARCTSVVTVGRTGLVCFVAGTVISVTVDAVSRHGTLHGARGLVVACAGDAATIAAVIGVALLWQRMAVRERGQRLGSHARQAVRRMLRA